MAKQVKGYNPSQITFTFNGFIITGYADEMVRVTMQSVAFEDEVGADGEVVIIDQNDYRGTFAVTLMQTSRSNQIFTDFMNASRLTGPVVGPASLKDQISGETYNAPTAWVRSWPEKVFSKRAEALRWEIRTNNMIMNPIGTEAL